MTAFPDPIAWESTLPIRPSSPAWIALLRGYYGTELTPTELEAWRALTGLEEPPAGGHVELLVVAGRRGGKSETIARIAVFEALHGGHGIALAPGQVGLIVIISPLREQSREIIGYVKGLAGLRQVAAQVTGDTTDSVTFRTGIRIQVMTADAVNVSGPTIVMAIREEWAKHPGADSSMPDTETENSLRPALAPVEGAPPRRLIGITSAYIKDGLAYETDRDNFGHADAPVLVARGPSWLFNPNLSATWLERERKRVGASVFAREYEAQWVDAIQEGWFGDAIYACIDKGVTKREPVKGARYVIAIDAAFRGDQFAVSVAHAERRDGAPPLVIQDYCHAWKRPGPGVSISVEQRAADIRKLCDIYETHSVYADQHCFDPLVPIFSRLGIQLTERAWSATNKAPTYRTARDSLTDGRWRLLDVPEQTREFCAIRGELLRSGTERIEAGFGHDDRVSAAVLSMTEAARHAGVKSNAYSMVRHHRAGFPKAMDGALGSAPRDRGQQF